MFLSERRWACTPPPSPSWANFSIVMGSTQESGRCHSMGRYTRPKSTLPLYVLCAVLHPKRTHGYKKMETFERRCIFYGKGRCHSHLLYVLLCTLCSVGGVPLLLKIILFTVLYIPVIGFNCYHFYFRFIFMPPGGPTGPWGPPNQLYMLAMVWVGLLIIWYLVRFFPN